MNGLKTMVCGKTCIGLAAGAAAAFCWGFHAVLVRRLVTDIPGIAIAVIRLYVAVAAIFLLLKLRRAPIRFAARGNWPYLLVAGLFGVALNFFFFHKGLEYTTAANAMLIEGSAPILVLLMLALVFKDTIGRREVMAVFLTFAGLAMVVGGDLQFDANRLIGDGLELLAAITWALFIIASSKSLHSGLDVSGRLASLLTLFAVAAIALTPVALFTPFTITPTDAALLCLLGILPTAVAYALWYEAATRLSTVAASLVFNLSIVFTLINSHIFLDEAVTTPMAAGSGLVIIGVVISQIGKRES